MVNANLLSGLTGRKLVHRTQLLTPPTPPYSAWRIDKSRNLYGETEKKTLWSREDNTVLQGCFIFMKCVVPGAWQSAPPSPPLPPAVPFVRPAVGAAPMQSAPPSPPLPPQPPAVPLVGATWRGTHLLSVQRHGNVVGQLAAHAQDDAFRVFFLVDVHHGLRVETSQNYRVTNQTSNQAMKSVN